MPIGGIIFSYAAEKFLGKLDEVINAPVFEQTPGYEDVDTNLQNAFH